MDNCILDELGIIAARQGSSKFSTQLDSDPHSLYTTTLSGTKHRMVASRNDIFDNFSNLGVTMTGSGDVAFGSYLGQIFFARSTSKKKYDGSTVRNWGIAAPPFAPSPVRQAPPFNALASATQWTLFEGTKTDVDDMVGLGGVVPLLTPDPATNRGTINRAYGQAVAIGTFQDGGSIQPGDELFLWVYVTEPSGFQALTLAVDVNGGNFNLDYYTYTWGSTQPVPLQVPDTEFLGDVYDVEGFDRLHVLHRRERRPTPVTAVRPDKPGVVSNIGWNKLSIKVGQMQRVGATENQTWNTAFACRITIKSSTPVAIEVPYIEGGSNFPISGKYKYRYAFVKDFGNYQAISPLSTPSNEVQFEHAKVNVGCSTIGVDTQADKIWVYRMGGELDAYYRVATAAIGGGFTTTVVDQTSDRDALITNIRALTDTLVPPNTIIGLEGPYYDRMFAMTATTLYMSRRRMPDNFSAGQAITVGDVTETPYWVKKAYGGLYIGTSKDIYRLDGTGAENPDNTMDFVKTPLNIGNPPISVALAQEGNFLVYLAADGWRAFNGADSTAIRGDTDLLYKGYTRDSVGPVNISSSSARFRAAIAHGQLVAITPEGGSTISSSVIYRYDFSKQLWYRHTYPREWVSILREPDGTLIAGDTFGFIWQLDTGPNTQDNNIGIPILIDTKFDDNDAPLMLKRPTDTYLQMYTGTQTASVGIYLDGASSATTTLSLATTSVDIASATLHTLPNFTQIKFRISLTANAGFQLHDLRMHYNNVAEQRRSWEIMPVDADPQWTNWLRLMRVKINAAADLTVTPYFDDTAFSPYSITVGSLANKATIFDVPVGREYKGRVTKILVTSASGFYPYWMDLFFRPSGNQTEKAHIRVGVP